jgi:serine/threonine-protein kinase
VDRDSWSRLEAVFFEALELPEAERTAFLDRACGDDADFRREVEAVLRGHSAAGGTSDSDGLLPSTSLVAGGALPAGTRLGAYRIEALIGRGGMGDVYRASRADAQYEQQVAIKLMRPGRDATELLRRFRTERQILARLQHPGIATLLDGGVTETGQPFLVMQYVEGETITAYSAARSLGFAGRLRLFLAVCDAVEFAHRNLIVHRDLKPGNILVTANAEVRLLDFGIAKLLDRDAAGSAATTGELLLLTPEHAAPEQFLGSPVTTATDVWALGVLLYELLSGTRPFQFVPAVDLHRAVCQQDPERPSAAAADGARLARAGLDRPPVPPAALVGDLDSIVLKAIRKEPERRFQSAADLAEDVRRHLTGFPVRARPETMRYVVGRFVQRHRGGVLASAALAVALLALAVVSIRFAVTSRAQARAIAEERDVAVQVSAFLENLFRSADPFGPGGERLDTLRVRDILDEGTRKLKADLAGQPEVQARLLTVLGRVQSSLGRLDAATPLLEEARAMLVRERGADASETAAAEVALGETLWQAGRAAAAESVFRSALRSLERDSVANRDERSTALTGMGNALHRLGRFPEAEAAYRHALTLAEQEHGPTNPRISPALSNLAAVLVAQAKRQEAETVFTRAIALARAGDPVHPRVGPLLGQLANLRAEQGAFDEAERLHREALDVLRASLAEPHPRIASGLNNLAAVYLRAKRFAEADSVFTEALAMHRAVHGDRHPSVAGTLQNLAQVRDAQGRLEEGLALKRESRATLIATLGSDHPTVAIGHNNVGASLHLLGRHEEAIREFQHALAVRRVKLGQTHPLTANSLWKIGFCLLELRRFTPAEEHLQAARRALEPRRSEEAQQWNTVLDHLVRLYRETGRESDAASHERMRVPSGS